jgi:serine/threonine-protein kinase
MSSDPTAASGRPLRIGRYQVLGRIATGGMGAVYKALDLKRGREVALKVLPEEQAVLKPVLLDRFRLEARYGRRFNHENVVSLYDYGEDKGMYFLALEYIDGIDLHDYVTRKEKLPVEESRELLVQAARAVAHVHQHGIVHRDIKPANFLVTERQGRPFVKLIDLGLARRMRDTESRVTVSGTTVGTVDYMSPEQARDSSSVDVRADIYSLGCTWFHLLAGRPPFGEGPLTERVYNHVATPPPDVRQFNRDVPEEIVKVLERMLAKDPADRYQTLEDLLRALEGLSTRRTQLPAALPGLVAAPENEPVAEIDSDLDSDIEGVVAVVDGGSRDSESEEPSPATARVGGRRFLDAEAEETEDFDVIPEPRKRRRRDWGAILAVALGVLVVGGLIVAGCAELNRSTPSPPALAAPGPAPPDSGAPAPHTPP